MDPHLNISLKKPKLEPVDPTVTNGSRNQEPNKEVEEEVEEGEQEEALIALIDHRTHEVEQNKHRLAYYNSQLELSERRLKDSQSQLSRLRSRRLAAKSASSSVAASAAANGSPIKSRPLQARTQLIIPPASTRNVAPPREAAAKPMEKVRREPVAKAAPLSSEKKKKATKRVFEQKEQEDLIPSIRSSSSPCKINFQGSTHISSQHKRKLRSLVASPVNDLMFVTSALDGIVNLWQIQGKGHGASFLSSFDCVSPKQRRWPEDITWHPDGDSLFAVYSADGGDSQVSILNLNQSGDKKVVFLEDKPHLRGILNSIVFLPWADLCFATGGSDHAVILWSEKDGSWKPKTLHRSQHTSAVMGVAGLQQKKVILSVGADKRIIGFDMLTGRAEFKHQIESKCMSVLPNPSDFNLFMVQSGQPGQQLRLYDIRLRQTELHAFGWKQESSESQSALINQAWSPDGFYLSSGSADPMFHVFDIRYKGSSPSQSVQAHQKRVFKAVWHKSLPLLTSISSDLNIGLHRIT